jgi:hypothetical protein
VKEPLRVSEDSHDTRAEPIKRADGHRRITIAEGYLKRRIGVHFHLTKNCGAEPRDFCIVFQRSGFEGLRDIKPLGTSEEFADVEAVREANPGQKPSVFVSVRETTDDGKGVIRRIGSCTAAPPRSMPTCLQRGQARQVG